MENHLKKFGNLLNQNKNDQLTSYIRANIKNINKKNLDGDTMLHGALRFGASLEIIKLICESGANVNIKNEKGFTPLHESFVFPGIDEEIFKYFLDNGADINTQTKYGLTMLMTAVCCNAPTDILQLFLDFNANLFLRTPSDQNIFDIVALAGHKEGCFLIWKYFLNLFWFFETNKFINLMQWLPIEILTDIIHFIVQDELNLF